LQKQGFAARSHDYAEDEVGKAKNWERAVVNLKKEMQISKFQAAFITQKG